MAMGCCQAYRWFYGCGDWDLGIGASCVDVGRVPLNGLEA
jgi:hypothetical protein